MRAWPGAEKFTMKFPPKVLQVFLESFGFVNLLASKSEVEVMEEYLVGRWSALGCMPMMPADCEVAVMRLALMAQGFEKTAVESFKALNSCDQQILSVELARTGRLAQFQRTPSH